MNKLLAAVSGRWMIKYFYLILMGLVVIIFSFQEVELDFNTGIDPSLKWLYNHLFNTGLDARKRIVFPHGPLAFLMYPLAANFILSVIVTVLLQIIFMIQLYQLLGGQNWFLKILTFVLAWLIFSISNFNQLILSNIAAGYLLFFSKGSNTPKYIGLVLTAFAFYVKAYVAIFAGMLTFSFFLINFLRKKKFKESLVDLAIMIGAMLLFWISFYSSISGFIDYYFGMFHLAGDNSAATAFYPENNWLLIVPMIVVILIIPFQSRSRKSLLAGLLFILSFFAAWKYGMSREDYAHVRTFLYFVVISMALLLIYIRRNWLINIAALLICFILFALNMNNLEGKQPLSISYNGIGNFIQFVGDFHELKETNKLLNEQNIEMNKLPESVRKQIGNSTADIYPWDYTIVAANNLNWQARPVIQSYAAYTSWLDGKNADHFRNNSPQYFIWKTNNRKADISGNSLESIDNRYLLNDEPQTLIELLKNYQRLYSDSSFLVLEKRSQKLTVNSSRSETQSAGWNQWISVPQSPEKLIRMKLHLKRNVPGKIKSFLYKDEMYYMNLRTTDGDIFKYRIVPDNAEDGIWISPFYASIGTAAPPRTISDVWVTCSDMNHVMPTISFEWEYFDLDNNTLNHFFGKDIILGTETFCEDVFSLETDHSKWENFQPEKVKIDSKINRKVYGLDVEAYSPSLRLNIDHPDREKFARIMFAGWIKMEPGSMSAMVIEAETTSGEKKWHGVGLDEQIVDHNEFNPVVSYLDLDSTVNKVTVYIWNNGKKPVSLLSMNVRLYRYVPNAP